MITILHGDDVGKSRNYLFDIKSKTGNTHTFYKDSFDLQNLIQIVEGTALFGQTKSVIFEEFLSAKKGETETLVEYLIKHSQTHDFYLWESRQLTASFLLPFKQAHVKLFNLPQTLFSFLDSLKPSSTRQNIANFHNALANLDADFLFHMIIRQFRLMIAVLDSSSDSIDEIKRLAPWQKSKLIKQAHVFGIDSLITQYKKLNSIEYQQKSGMLPSGLERSIDFFLLSF